MSGSRASWARRGGSVHQLVVVAAAFAIPPALVTLNLVFSVRLTQLLVIGPCVAAAVARPRVVAASAVWTLALMTYLAGPNATAGTAQELFTTGGGVAVGVVCTVTAWRREHLERSVSALESRRRIFADLVESSTDAVSVHSADGTVTVWNEGAARLYGYPAAVAVGMDIAALCPPGLGECPPEPGEKDAGDGGPDEPAGSDHAGQRESTRRHADGTVLTVSLSTSRLVDATGRAVATATVSRDLGPHRRAEADRRAALEHQIHQLQRVQGLGQMAGGVAHTFNNLLAVILGSAEFIEDGSDDPAVRADAAQITTAAARGAHLTRQLLQFARDEPGPGRPVDLDEVIATATKLLEFSAGDAVTVDVVPAGQPVVVEIDPGQVEQLLLNLVVNARDAMPGGGTVTIATTVHTDGSGAPTTVRLSVTDTGPGITADVAVHAFEPFFTTRAHRNNVGLGLATVAGIVTTAGGQVAIRPGAGGGTAVEVDLPALVEATAAAAALPDRRGPRGPRVLVVDDEAALLALIERILTGAGYEVTTAGCGADALTRTDLDRVDLLLTDLVMPGTSGRALADELNRRRPDLPVLYMSGYSDTTLTDVDRDVDLLPKPFTRPDLLRRVADALRRSDPTGR